ncbi:peptidase inhibitor family I36 protein [Streptomyces sp. NPDC051133]|uniref:peptidase inhibitor family I36 protein n=1 Tax=Streptomyces sp. NPDC051133 TaxID=3155521 RepID=UPI00343C7821
MTARLKPLALLATAAASATLVVGASITPAAASDGVTAKSAADFCHKKDFCLWSNRNFSRTPTPSQSQGTTALPDWKCGKGSYDPWHSWTRPMRSVWNRTGHTWQALDKHGKVKLKLAAGKQDKDIKPYKEIKRWCWK